MFQRRVLDQKHTIYTNSMFPAKLRKPLGRGHRVVLGVGGNLGDTRRRFIHLWVYIGRIALIKRVQSGVILKNPPFGYNEQDDFYNTVMEVSTTLSPRTFLRLVWRIEKRFGRVRSFANAPRTLDLDIVFYGKKVINTAELCVPHPHWQERLSVTIPLRSMNRTIRREYENLNI